MLLRRIHQAVAEEQGKMWNMRRCLGYTNGEIEILYEILANNKPKHVYLFEGFYSNKLCLNLFQEVAQVTLRKNTSIHFLKHSINNIKTCINRVCSRQDENTILYIFKTLKKRNNSFHCSVIKEESSLPVFLERLVFRFHFVCTI